MTSENQDDNLHEFLILNWLDIDIIINRNQFFASVFLEEVDKYSSHAEYFSSLMKYHGDTLPVFDFNAFLKDTFRSGINSMFNIALICNVSLFSEENQTVYRNDILKENTDFSKDYLALKVTVQAGIKRVPLSEIRLIPLGLREKLHNEGFLGCRFTIENNIQYFVDIESIIFKSMQKKR